MFTYFHTAARQPGVAGKRALGLTLFGYAWYSDSTFPIDCIPHSHSADTIRHPNWNYDCPFKHNVVRCSLLSVGQLHGRFGWMICVICWKPFHNSRHILITLQHVGNTSKTACMHANQLYWFCKVLLSRSPINSSCYSFVVVVTGGFSFFFPQSVGLLWTIMLR